MAPPALEVVIALLRPAALAIVMMHASVLATAVSIKKQPAQLSVPVHAGELLSLITAGVMIIVFMLVTAALELN